VPYLAQERLDDRVLLPDLREQVFALAGGVGISTHDGEAGMNERRGLMSVRLK
jgi:hypothetical protein